MPETTLLNVSIRGTSAVPPYQASVEYFIETGPDDARKDYVGYTLALTNPIQESLSLPFRKIGATVEVDLGDGALTTIDTDDLGEVLHFSSSLEGYSDSVSFQRQGVMMSPFKTSAIRGKRRCRITGALGVPGSVGQRVILDGYTAQGNFSDWPPSGTFTVYDAAMKYQDLLLAYDLDPGSRMTRQAVLASILATYNIPAGDLDLGPDGGGIVYKPLSVAGDVPVLEWIREFLKPCGVRIYFRDGELCAKKFRPSTGTVDRTYTVDDVDDVQIQIPWADTPNAITTTSVVFGYLGPTGQRTLTDPPIITRGTYAPLTATQKQDHTSGALTPVSLVSDAVDRVISKKVTTSTYDGGNLVLQWVDEWGWYAPIAAPNYQDGAGVISYNPDIDVYQFPDGSWRSQPNETFMIVRRTFLNKFFTDAGFLDYKWFQSQGYTNQRNVRAIIDLDDVTELPQATYLAGDGTAVRRAAETFEDGWRYTKTRYYADPVTLLLTSTFEDRYVRKSELIPMAAGAYVYGSADVKEYRRDAFDDMDGFDPSDLADPRVAVETTVVTFSPVSATEHSETRHYRLDGRYTAGGLATFTNYPPFIVPGTVPHIEELTNKQHAQEARATALNSVGVALSGRIDAYIESQFAETIGELRTISNEEMRDGEDQNRNSWTVVLTTGIDWIRKGSTITYFCPELGMDLRMLVWNIEGQLNLRTGENSQTVTARYYPPELGN